MKEKRFMLWDLFGEKAEIEIPDSDAFELKAAYDFLIAISSIEDLFSLIAISYSDFEKFVFESSLAAFVDGYHTGDAPFEMAQGRMRDEANQKLLSLTNAYRALIDQAPQRLRSANSFAEGVADGFKRLRSIAFDGSIEFRIFDFLRNMTTHHMLPIRDIGILTSLLFENKADLENSPRVKRHTLEMTVDRTAIIETKKGRRKTKEELGHMVEGSIDLKVIVRGFISALFRFRKEFHGEFEDKLIIACQYFENAYKRFAASTGHEAKFLELYEKRSDTGTKLCPIKRTFPDLVQKQMARSKGLVAVDKAYPSIEIAERQGVYQSQKNDLWRR